MKLWPTWQKAALRLGVSFGAGFICFVVGHPDWVIPWGIAWTLATILTLETQ